MTEMIEAYPAHPISVAHVIIISGLRFEVGIDDVTKIAADQRCIETDGNNHNVHRYFWEVFQDKCKLAECAQGKEDAVFYTQEMMPALYIPKGFGGI
jgi:hypothetical protein